MTADERMRTLALKLLQRDISSLDADERDILESIACRTTVSRDVSADKIDTFWDRLADRVAAVGGSWAFIFSFFGVLIGWMLLNTEILAAWKLAFDPYPYIFLNLMLSMIAAIQAPIIMMSQNRQTARDRIAAEHDYEVNLKSELEIMSLHEKWDSIALNTLDSRISALNVNVAELRALIVENSRQTPNRI